MYMYFADRPYCIHISSVSNPEHSTVQTQPRDTFRPMPGLISCAGVTGSVGICHIKHAQHRRLALVLHMYMYILHA